MDGHGWDTSVVMGGTHEWCETHGVGMGGTHGWETWVVMSGHGRDAWVVICETRWSYVVHLSSWAGLINDHGVYGWDVCVSMGHMDGQVWSWAGHKSGLDWNP